MHNATGMEVIQAADDVQQSLVDTNLRRKNKSQRRLRTLQSPPGGGLWGFQVAAVEGCYQPLSNMSSTHSNQSSHYNL